MKTIASASISGSTMHDIASNLNRYVKAEFKNKASVSLKVTGKYKGRLFLEVGNVDQETAYNYFKGFVSHAVKEEGL